MKGIVYLICDPSNDCFKIGVTRNKTVSNRLLKLQTGNPTELFIINSYKTNYPFMLEKMLHNHFHNLHINGEWYQLNVDDITNFNDICDTLSLRIESLKNNPFVKLK